MIRTPPATSTPWTLPMPLSEFLPGDGRRFVGTVEHIWIDGKQLHASGTLNQNPREEDWIPVNIDLCDAETSHHNGVWCVDTWRLASIGIAPPGETSAFPGAFIELPPTDVAK